jgi:hypothetical protein
MTGTISTTGNVVRGTSTLFENEFKVGDFLYNGDKAVRKITKILSNILMELEATFVADLAGGTVARKCEPQVYKVIQVENSSANAAELQEAPFAAGSRVILWGAPIAYDALTGTLAFTVSK